MSTRSASLPLVSSDRVASVAAACGWRLDARRAMTLRPHVPSRLQITQGSAWVTLGLPHQGAGNESGDHVLEAGESLEVPAGARLVMEPWPLAGAGAAPVRFDWRAESEVQPAERPGRFGREVVVPSRELAEALGQAGWAFLRLLRGVFGYSEYLVAGRGRVLTPFESNPP
ncbi:MAG: DUF2917 domain-containing protein [Hydrogenophaga sp.]|jgi:hypothetical protein|uniref:DUF2917 domain-containing protein n=1 Tax=Hydrogenophaga sp. TaxID=1904254 RepID=UPI00262E2C99|nr:DUF2917 domain-containing protein [Hydrogenophaga sp.]MCV0440960.1 DUF2917 domain-containing protein [Hydrogenophaga sp.]